MKKLAIHARDRNHPIQLDLFSRREAPPRNASRVALHIANRFGISLDHANTVAQLAGFGADEAHHDS